MLGTNGASLLSAEQVSVVLGRMIHLHGEESAEFARHAQKCWGLACLQEPGWFVPYGKLIFVQQRLIQTIIKRSHAS